MAQYSYAEIMKMQNDAARRVEEMQRRTREMTQAPPTEKQPPKHIPMPDGYLDPPRPVQKTESTPAAPRSLPVADRDSALILSVILLLAEEGADETLLLALLYMLA